MGSGQCSVDSVQWAVFGRQCSVGSGQWRASFVFGTPSTFGSFGAFGTFGTFGSLVHWLICHSRDDFAIRGGKGVARQIARRDPFPCRAAQRARASAHPATLKRV